MCYRTGQFDLLTTRAVEGIAGVASIVWEFIPDLAGMAVIVAVFFSPRVIFRYGVNGFLPCDVKRR